MRLFVLVIIVLIYANDYLYPLFVSGQRGVTDVYSGSVHGINSDECFRGQCYDGERLDGM